MSILIMQWPLCNTHKKQTCSSEISCILKQPRRRPFALHWSATFTLKVADQINCIIRLQHLSRLFLSTTHHRKVSRLLRPSRSFPDMSSPCWWTSSPPSDGDAHLLEITDGSVAVLVACCYHSREPGSCWRRLINGLWTLWSFPGICSTESAVKRWKPRCRLSEGSSALFSWSGVQRTSRQVFSISSNCFPSNTDGQIRGVEKWHGGAFDWRESSHWSTCISGDAVHAVENTTRPRQHVSCERRSTIWSLCLLPCACVREYGGLGRETVSYVYSGGRIRHRWCYLLFMMFWTCAARVERSIWGVNNVLNGFKSSFAT